MQTTNMLAVLWTFFFLGSVWAETRTFHFNTTYVLANPDGLHERRVVGINNGWPIPIIRAKKNDRVLIYLTNGLEDQNTSLHFHGLFQNGSNIMDGPQLVTQCPIPPGETLLYNFTVTDQSGTYWYHSHTGSQYADGLRGMFIIEDDDLPFDYDEEVPLTLSDWYHEEAPVIVEKFLSRYNPTGFEPIPQSNLFNDSTNVQWEVSPNTTYLLRVANVGMFVSQYLYIEDHEFTIVEIDGVLVEPVTVSSLYITVGQRYGVLLKTKSQTDANYPFVNVFDEPMLDFHPPDLHVFTTNWLVYNKKATLPKRDHIPITDLEVYDDFKLKPAKNMPLFDDYDYQISLNFLMEVLGDGRTYALFNNHTYVAPKIPSLLTALSSTEDMASNPQIYGSNTNSFVLQKDDVVEIVINNQDPGKHPFHLHGHNFQVISRSPASEDDEISLIYDETNPDHTNFPQYPMVRDTIMVEANGFVVLRFKANNPGVWFFHCHVDWHLEQGLAIVLVEAPVELQKSQSDIPEDHLRICKASGYKTEGNAAGNSRKWLDLKHENLQPNPLPEGFTLKGYVALLISTLCGLYGISTIFVYGMEDVNANNEQVIGKLYAILQQHDGGMRVGGPEYEALNEAEFEIENDERSLLGKKNGSSETEN